MRKIRISSRVVFAFLIISTFSIIALAQIDEISSPARWEYYSDNSEKVSFRMPRLPVAVDESDRCRGEKAVAYGSYTNGTGYVIRITSKFDGPRNCPEKREFGETNFNERVAYLKNSPFELKERAGNSSKIVVLEGKNRIHKLVRDSKSHRWFEFLVVGGDESKPEVREFLASLETNGKKAGIEIGRGAERTLGDQAPPKNSGKAEKTGATGDSSVNKTETRMPQSSSNTLESEGVTVVLKPRANYTDQARKNQTQGKVTLRVVFKANGGIGAISLISGLDDGLTEQAIAAAKRLVFVPAQRNGVRYTVVKPVEYTFTIY